MPGEHRAGVAASRPAPRRRPATPRRSSSATSWGTVAPGGEQSRVAGVHAAEQRLDEPVHDLVAEPRRDQRRRPRRPRRRASGGRVSRGAGVRARPQTAPRTSRPARASAGTPITERGNGRRRPAGPDRRRRGRRVHESSAIPTLASEVDRLGATGEHGLGTDVDLDAADSTRSELAADPRRRPRARGPRARPRPGAIRCGGASPAMPARRRRRRGAAPGMRRSLVTAGSSGTEPRGRAVVRPCAPLASSRSRPAPCCLAAHGLLGRRPTATRREPPPRRTEATRRSAGDLAESRTRQRRPTRRRRPRPWAAARQRGRPSPPGRR